MAGHSFTMPDGSRGFVDYADGWGSARIGSRVYHWEMHWYCGPTFLRKDGEPLANQPGEHHPVWKPFYKWHRRWLKKNPREKFLGKVKKTVVQLEA